MNVLVYGCSKVGAYLAADLARDGNEVTLMDTNMDHLDSVFSEPNIEVVPATGSLMHDLRLVKMDDIEVFFALTDNDAQNAMAAQVASRIFHVPEVVALISDPERHKIYKELGLDVVCPALALEDAIKGATKLKAQQVER